MATANTQGTTLHRAVVPDPAAAPRSESRKRRRLRHARRYRLYASAFVAVALLSILVALIAVNARAVKLDWLVGSSRISLVWVILFTAVVGWLLGLRTAVLVRHRSRRPPTQR